MLNERKVNRQEGDKYTIMVRYFSLANIRR